MALGLSLNMRVRPLGLDSLLCMIFDNWPFCVSSLLGGGDTHTHKHTLNGVNHLRCLTLTNINYSSSSTTTSVGDVAYAKK